MFDSHSQMAVPYESHFTVGMALARRRYQRGGGFDAAAFLRDLAASEGFAAWNLSPDAVGAVLAHHPPGSLAEAVRLAYWTYARSQGKTRYGEKSPGYVMHLPLLAGLFPEARFVHIIRDGRNVALSYLEAGWGPRDLEEAAYYWRRFVCRGRRTGRRLGPDRYREVRYEDVVEDPETHVRSLCRFLDLRFEEGMLRYFERADAILGKLQGQPWVRGHQNLYRPPTRGLRDWRREMARRDLEVFEALAGDLLEELGYERAVPHLSPSARANGALRWARVQGRRALRRLRKARRA
jgi:hypothetical protein